MIATFGRQSTTSSAARFTRRLRGSSKSRFPIVEKPWQGAPASKTSAFGNGGCSKERSAFLAAHSWFKLNVALANLSKSYAAKVLKPCALKPRSSPPQPEKRLVADHCAAATEVTGRACKDSGCVNVSGASCFCRAAVAPGRLLLGLRTATAGGVDELRASEAKLMVDRPRSISLDAILGQEIRVLDHGFIRVVDYMGNDDAIVQAARVSYGSGTKSVSDDRNLIRYLLRHRHTTPFEMAEIKLHVKLPIFVARQWIRHRMASVNEYSARYSVLDREFYMPAREAIAVQSKDNRQGRSSAISGNQAEKVERSMAESAESAYDTYLELLNEDSESFKSEPGRSGIARELARAILPVSYYTQWYWKIDLHNLMHFLELRADRHAQYEIRKYAEEILKIVKEWVPHTYEAFIDYRAEAVSISGPALRILKRILAGERVSESESGLSSREWRELVATLQLKLE